MHQFYINIDGEQGSSDLIPGKVMFRPADTPALSAADQSKKSPHDILMLSSVSMNVNAASEMVESRKPTYKVTDLESGSSLLEAS